MGAGTGKEENNQLGLLLGAEFITDNSTATIPSVPVNIGDSEVFQLKDEVKVEFSIATK